MDWLRVYLPELAFFYSVCMSNFLYITTVWLIWANKSAIGLLKVAASQSCDSTGTAGIDSVRSSPANPFAEYGLFLNLENPITCTGKVTEFEYSFYRIGHSNKAQFELQLSLWRPREDGVYNKVCEEHSPLVCYCAIVMAVHNSGQYIVMTYTCMIIKIAHYNII